MFDNVMWPLWPFLRQNMTLQPFLRRGWIYSLWFERFIRPAWNIYCLALDPVYPSCCSLVRVSWVSARVPVEWSGARCCVWRGKLQQWEHGCCNQTCMIPSVRHFFFLLYLFFRKSIHGLGYDMNNIRTKLLKLFVVPDGVSRVDWVPTDAILVIRAPGCYPQVVDKVKQDRWDEGETRKIQVWFFFPTREAQVAIHRWYWNLVEVDQRQRSIFSFTQSRNHSFHLILLFFPTVMRGSDIVWHKNQHTAQEPV